MIKPGHEWVRRARTFQIEQYHPPFWPDIDFDAKQLVDVVRKYHANAIRFGSAGKWAVFPNEFFPPHPQLGERDLLAETIAEAHARDVRVIGYIPVGHIIPEDNMLIHHPEWMYRPSPEGDAPVLRHHGGGFHRHVCFNTPYREAICAFIAQVVDHDVDAIYTDSACPYHSHHTPQSPLCYCDYCLEKFERQFGCPMPYAPDPHSLPREDREMLEAWSLQYGRIVGDVFLEFAAATRKKKDIPVLTHGLGVGNWPERRIVEVHDGFLYEAGGDFLHRLEAASLAESSGWAMWQYVGALTGWSRAQCFGMELVEEAAASFASGGGVLVACGVNLWLSPPHKANRELAALLEILERNESLFEDLHPSPFVAIPFVLPVRVYEMLERLRFRAEPLVMRDRPRDVIGQSRQDLADRPREREAPLSEAGYLVRTPPQQSCRRGAFSAMLANHLPMSVIEERVLSDPAALAKYPVLLLPNVGHLTRKEVEGITEYVKAGGRLLATYRTSLYGAEPDEMRDNFALADLLGVDRVDPNPDQFADYEQHLWAAGTFDTYGCCVPGQWLAERCSHELWPLNRFEFVQARPGTDVVANIVFGGREDDALCPAVTCRTVGKGRVVYLAAPVEELHFEYRLLVVRDLLGAVVDWLYPEGRPLMTDGPNQLVMIPNEKPGSQVLFLINHTGERVEHLPEIWPRFSPQFDYVTTIPEVNLRWQLTERGAPRRVWDVCTGDDLEVTFDGNHLETILTNIGQYAMIAAEF